MYPVYIQDVGHVFLTGNFLYVDEVLLFSQYVILNICIDIKMDVRDMSDFESGSFDAVIDKGSFSNA